MGREWQVTPTERGLPLRKRSATLDLPAPALVGAHQIDNAATAVACIERLRAAQFAIDDTAIRKGLASVEWPARLQRLTRGAAGEARCRRAANCGSTAATTRIAAWRWRRMAADWAKEPAPLPLYLVFAMLTTKDASGFLRPLARHAAAARAVPFPEGHGAYTPAEACAAGRRGRARLPCRQTTSARRWRTCWPPSPRRCAF